MSLRLIKGQEDGLQGPTVQAIQKASGVLVYRLDRRLASECDRIRACGPPVNANTSYKQKREDLEQQGM